MLDKHLIAKTKPKANAAQIVVLGNTRITVITPELLRVEVADSLKFTDEATQIVWFRDKGAHKYTVDFDDKEIVIRTEKAVFFYDRKKGKMDSVELDGKKVPCNNKENLKGTARTLDLSFGKIPLEDGVVGRNGVAVFEDNSLILDADGMVKKRVSGTDTYVIASLDYSKSLKAFFAITGFPPMIPRYALGNWWSRYYRYTQKEYIALMDRFKEEDIPFSVATIDMDWHWVFMGLRFGLKNLFNFGWTGYSWNTNLFPDYKKFLSDLHERGLRTSLNLHPAKGVRDYEDMYEDMCRAMDMDPNKKETVQFDLTDPKFINAYFSVLHKPYEKDGVDSWWIDWQQGTKSKLEGYDPLWGLNHYHYLDNAAGGKRPMILSRYGGLGSHRYPLGFSGDAAIRWSVLDFQPYFTATAANAGYLTWSHDIGGHHLGKQSDQELFLRWVQLGVFSPVMRLHSSNTAKAKAPWNYPKVEKEVKEFLRLRHKLIPYIYSAYYRAHSEGRAVCEPMYYKHPRRNESYEFQNQYYFGPKLLVAPITSKADKKTGIAKVEVWLPEGRFTDIFTGEVFEGGKTVTIERDFSSIPVLAKSGAILPLSNNKGNDTSNPKSLDIFAYSGNGSFSLYEDDGETNDYIDNKFATTKMSIESSEKNAIVLTIDKAEGDISFIPKEREYNIFFKDILSFEKAVITVNGKETEGEIEATKISISGIKPTDSVTISLEGAQLIKSK